MEACGHDIRHAICPHSMCLLVLIMRAVASCDKCNHGHAYFLQLQIRSADEPMTTCEQFELSCRSICDLQAAISYPPSLSVNVLVLFSRIWRAYCLITAANPVVIDGQKTEALCRMWAYF